MEEVMIRDTCDCGNSRLLKPIQIISIQIYHMKGDVK